MFTTPDQVPCKLLESENGVNHGCKSRKIQDCEAINASTEAARLKRAKILELKPGQYVFRVTNCVTTVFV